VAEPEPHEKPKPNQRAEFNASVVEAFGRVVSQLSRVASTLIGFAFLAYLVGWVRTRAYFGEFGAVWLADQVPVSVLISNSVAPLFYLSFFTLTLATDIAEGLRETSARRLALVLLAAAAAAGVASLFVPPRIAVLLGHLTVIAWVIVAAELFVSLAMSLRRSQFTWHSTAVWGFAVVFWFGLYSAPNALGSAEGRRDRDVELSNLARVSIEPAEDSTWRLLAASGDLLYIANLGDGRRYPKLKIVSATSVESISRRSANDDATGVSKPD